MYVFPSTQSKKTYVHPQISTSYDYTTPTRPTPVLAPLLSRMKSPMQGLELSKPHMTSCQEKQGLLTQTLVPIRDRQPLISIRISMNSQGGEGLIITMLRTRILMMTGPMTRMDGGLGQVGRMDSVHRRINKVSGIKMDGVSDSSSRWV